MKNWQSWGFVPLWVFPPIVYFVGWPGVVVLGLWLTRDAVNAFLELQEVGDGERRLKALEDRVEGLETEVSFKHR